MVSRSNCLMDANGLVYLRVFLGASRLQLTGSNALPSNWLLFESVVIARPLIRSERAYDCVGKYVSFYHLLSTPTKLVL